MRILAISYFLPPMLYPQAIQIGRLLAYASAEIAVVSGRGDEHGQALDCYRDLDRKFSFHVDVPHRSRLRGRIFHMAQRFAPFYARVPDEYRGWVSKAERSLWSRIEEAEFRPDVLVTFGEPMSDHILGLQIHRRLGVPWVAHFSDPWVDNPFRQSNLLSNFVNRIQERRVIEAADGVIFTSRETLGAVMGKYLASWASKTFVLPHSFDPQLYPKVVAKQRKVIVRHLGNFYGARTPYPLLRALRLLWDRDREALADVEIELIGRVPTGMHWHPVFRALPKDLVRIIDTIPYSESLRLMSEADLLLVMDAPAQLSVFLPSKLIDYVGAGKQVMGIVPPGTSASLIQRLGGSVADPTRKEDVVDALRSALHEARRRKSNGAGVWGDPGVRSEFLPERTAGDFLNILKAVVGARLLS